MTEKWSEERIQAELLELERAKATVEPRSGSGGNAE